MADCWGERLLTSLSEDLVLRGMGGNPDLKRHRPEVRQAARGAVQDATRLLEPQVIQRKLTIANIADSRLELEGGHTLHSSLLAERLAAAEQVEMILCTIGPRLEEEVTRLFPADPLQAMVLEGLGVAAVEMLALLACRNVERSAARQKLGTSAPYSPGMIGWDVNTGQENIFAALQPDPAVICLLPSGQMLPRKSTSLVIGLGAGLRATGKACDDCAMQNTCRYRKN